MKEIMKTIVRILHMLSFGGVMLAGALGMIYEIVGYARFEELLSAMGISNGLECIWIFAAIMLIVLISTHFIKAIILTK